MLSMALHLLLSFVFLAAFYTKITGRTDFKLYLQRLGIRKFPRITAFLVLAAELALAALYPTAVFPQIRAVAAVLLLGAFTYWLRRKDTLKSSGECGCFGNMSALNRFPLARNALLIALAAASFFFSHTYTIYETLLMWAFAIVAVLAAQVYDDARIIRQHIQRHVAQLLPMPHAGSGGEAAAHEPFSGEWALLELDMETPLFKEFDRLLKNGSYPTLVVILQAPQWLVQAKAATWRCHSVIANAVHQETKQTNPVIYKYTNKHKIVKIKESLQYLHQYHHA